MYENLMAGFNAVSEKLIKETKNQNEQVLVVNGDCWGISSSSIDYLITEAEKSDSGLFLPVLSEDCLEKLRNLDWRIRGGFPIASAEEKNRYYWGNAYIAKPRKISKEHDLLFKKAYSYKNITPVNIIKFLRDYRSLNKLQPSTGELMGSLIIDTLKMYLSGLLVRKGKLFEYWKNNRTLFDSYLEKQNMERIASRAVFGENKGVEFKLINDMTDANLLMDLDSEEDYANYRDNFQKYLRISGKKQ
ncbi:hypothetical protein GF327_06125 [Candidatus Woesearchaeota archaeon]|nr:hypothetical protein [Candidatus Woesearchaeota archaeon]